MCMKAAYKASKHASASVCGCTTLEYAYVHNMYVEIHTTDMDIHTCQTHTGAYTHTHATHKGMHAHGHNTFLLHTGQVLHHAA